MQKENKLDLLGRNSCYTALKAYEVFGSSLAKRKGMCQTNGTLFQAQLTQEVLKEQTKAAGEENKGNSREHGDREGQGIL